MRSMQFSGTFYASGKNELGKFIEEAVSNADVKAKQGSAVKAIVAPHAGYVYSGGIAAYSYKALAESQGHGKLDTAIIVGPNHTGLGEPIAVSMEDWDTPFGAVKNDKELSKAIIGSSKYISEDESAHSEEHSIEVQLPFLKYMFPGTTACFICQGDQSPDASKILSKAIIPAAKASGKRIAIIASSDFNHYEPASAAKEKDSKLLAAIEKLDTTEFNNAVLETQDSACGIGPIMVAMEYSKANGVSKATLLKYGNSGEATMDYSSVVAYSAIGFYDTA